jgi:hypothetical protein
MSVDSNLLKYLYPSTSKQLHRKGETDDATITESYRVSLSSTKAIA